MPPVFGPVSPSPMRLKSRAGASGSAVSPSHSASSDSSSPSRNSSTTTGRVAEAPLDEHLLQRRARLAPRRRRSPRPCRRRARRPSRRPDSRSIAASPSSTDVDDRVARGRHPGGRHHLLRVRLRALQPGGGRARPEAGDAGRRARVRQARRRAATSGPTTTRSTPAATAARANPSTSPDRARTSTPRVTRDPGVAGRAQHLGALRRARERTHDRVLAAARADDEDPHVTGRR